MDQNNQSESGNKDGGLKLSGVEALRYFTTKITENINNYYNDLDAENCKILGKPLGGLFAHTFRFTISSVDIEHVVFAKICPVFERLDPAKTEYETLQYLYEKMPKVEQDLGVARPLDYFPEINGYIQESVGTNNLRTYLLKENTVLRNKKSLTGLYEGISGSARWLKAFHSVSKQESPTYFNSTEFLNSFIDEFDYRELKNYYFSNDLMRQLTNLIASLSSLDDVVLMPCAKCHWDYSPGHIFLDNGRINVIDILGIDNKPIYEDIGYFLTVLAGMNNLPLYPFFDRRRTQVDFSRIFIETYFSGTGLKKDEFILMVNIYRLKYLIIYIINLYNAVCKRSHPLVGKLFAKFRFGKIFEQPIVNTISEIRHGLQKLGK